MTAAAQIEELLRSVTGIDAMSLGPSTVERAIRRRMAVRKLKEMADYASYLAESEEEWSELIEAVVVPETWFFRDREPFSALANFAKSEWLPAHPDGQLQLLSAPCSTGEEPYSMAMSLLDLGWPVARFRIDAVDISLEALVQAKRAVYSRNSFRGKMLDFRERHFQATPGGHLLNDVIRQSVRFQKVNLAAPDGFASGQCYDVIFCRNMLIYFDKPAQQRVIRTLHRLLSPAGILFVGHAEIGLFGGSEFVSAKLPMAFACRKASYQSGREVKKASIPKISPTISPRSIPVSGAGRLVPVLKSLPELPNPNSDHKRPEMAGAQTAALPATAELAEASRLADAGKLEAAATLCERHLRAHGASAPAYYLLGVVQDAKGDKQRATEFYRKVVYLEPNHYEALVHLALLSEQNGQPDDARQWRHRAQRVKERTKP